MLKHSLSVVVLLEPAYTVPDGVYVAVQQYEPDCVGACVGEMAVKVPPLVVMETVVAGPQFRLVESLGLGPHSWKITLPVRSGNGVAPEPVTVAESLTNVPGISNPVWL